MGYHCGRCDHEWIPRDPNIEPKVCPKCKSPYWNKPKLDKQTYADFREVVREVITKAGKPLTWTEVRTIGGLSQLFPNNRWVKQLEDDIKLRRTRDSHGIIRWYI